MQRFAAVSNELSGIPERSWIFLRFHSRELSLPEPRLSCWRQEKLVVSGAFGSRDDTVSKFARFTTHDSRFNDSSQPVNDICRCNYRPLSQDGISCTRQVVHERWWEFSLVADSRWVNDIPRATVSRCLNAGFFSRLCPETQVFREQLHYKFVHVKCFFFSEFWIQILHILQDG